MTALARPEAILNHRPVLSSESCPKVIKNLAMRPKWVLYFKSDWPIEGNEDRTNTMLEARKRCIQ
jgi:hypothetical protein